MRTPLWASSPPPANTAAVRAPPFLTIPWCAWPRLACAMRGPHYAKRMFCAKMTVRAPQAALTCRCACIVALLCPPLLCPLLCLHCGPSTLLCLCPCLCRQASRAPPGHHAHVWRAPHASACTSQRRRPFGLLHHVIYTMLESFIGGDACPCSGPASEPHQLPGQWPRMSICPMCHPSAMPHHEGWMHCHAPSMLLKQSACFGVQECKTYIMVLPSPHPHMWPQGHAPEQPPCTRTSKKISICGGQGLCGLRPMPAPS